MHSKNKIRVVFILTLLIGIIGFFGISLFYLNSTASFEKKEKSSANFQPQKRIEVAISGMYSTDCEHKITHKVELLDGVQVVSCSHTKGKAILLIDDQKASFEIIEEAINTTEYK